jgi:hypothetical protein
MTLAAIIAFALLASPSGPVPLSERRAILQAQPQTSPAASQPEAAKPAEPGQESTPAPAESPTQTAPPNTQPPAPAKKHHHKKKKPAPPGDAPTKIIVRNGGATEPTAQISPGGLSKQQASSQSQNTTQLLAGTNTNLQKLSGRQLSPAQQDTVKQIRTYMDQAKAATDTGDVQRAHNLAFKAHLLSDDLVKQ